MELTLNRKPTVRATTFGELLIDGAHECLTLEDAIREIAGELVELWKIPHETAIPSGRYRITLEFSHRFGPDTITINDVPGFDKIRMHGGTTIADTEGCVLVGDICDRQRMTIAGAKFDHVLDRLKVKVHAALTAGEEVWITINNPA